jgi:hypothetical protein
MQLHLADKTTVPSDLRIARQEHDALGDRLGKEDAIERVFVQTRQGVDIHRVLAADRKLRVPVIEQTATKDARFHAKIVAAELVLDGDLPQAGRAEEQIVVGIRQQCARDWRQTIGLSDRPQQDLRVEQQRHLPVPNSFAISERPMRLKSSGTVNSPLRKPSRRGDFGASSATTFTSGLPALAITNGSPLTARSTSFESWVFASWC